MSKQDRLGYAYTGVGILIMLLGILLIVSAYSCTRVQIDMLQRSKTLHSELEYWNTHELGRMATMVKHGVPLTDEDWRRYRWHRNFADRLTEWEKIHNGYIEMAADPLASEEKLTEVMNELVYLINIFLDDAERQGYAK